MRKSLPVTLVLTLSLLLAAACQTTPPAARSQPPAKPARQTQSQGPAVQPHEPASQETQTAAQEQLSAARQQQSAQPATLSTRRPGGSATARQLKRLGSSVATGVGGLIRRVETLLGIKREPASRPAPIAAPAAGVRVARPVPPDLVAVIVTGAIILVGSCLTLAAIIAGRRRGRGPSAPAGA